MSQVQVQPDPAPALAAARPDDVHAALLGLTGYRQARRRTGFAADGTAQYRKGYKVEPDGSYSFFNEKGQFCHVPAHRLGEQLRVQAEAPPPAPETASVEGGPAGEDPTEAGGVDVGPPEDADGEGTPAGRTRRRHRS